MAQQKDPMREIWEIKLILLFNFRLKLFLKKFKSKQSGSFALTKVLSRGEVKFKSEKNGRTFKINRQRLKHYYVDGSLGPLKFIPQQKNVRMYNLN